MKIDSAHLADLMVEIANEFFGPKFFTRRQLLDATEQILRQQRLWTRQDDKPSGATGSKSCGHLEIINRFADLQRWRVLLARPHSQWRLANPRLTAHPQIPRKPIKNTPALPSHFKHRENFENFLREHHLDASVRTYVSWINSAAQRLGFALGPSHLSCEADVQRLLEELHALDPNPRKPLFIKKPRMATNLRSAFRKYADMVQLNYLGLFKTPPAAPAPTAHAARAHKLPPPIRQNGKKSIPAPQAPIQIPVRFAIHQST